MPYQQFLWMGILAGYCTKKEAIQFVRMPAPQKGNDLYPCLGKGKGDDYVMVSENAASQPEVKLNLKEGEQYYLEDLLYSLMLKSHNDTAVAIAETSAVLWKGFAKMMNAKAKEIGCTNTHFVTPNGLDSEMQEAFIRLPQEIWL